MTPKQHERAKDLIRQFQVAQQELFSMGLTITSAHLSKTVDKMGWELAEKALQDGRVTESEQRYRDHLAKTDPRRLARHVADCHRDAAKMSN